VVRGYQEAAGMSGGSWGGPIQQTGTCGWADILTGTVNDLGAPVSFSAASFFSSVTQSLFLSLNVIGDERGGQGRVAMIMEG